MLAETVTSNGNNNELILTYVARPLGVGLFPSVALMSGAGKGSALARAIAAAEIDEAARSRAVPER
jgi:hypothetical protein